MTAATIISIVYVIGLHALLYAFHRRLCTLEDRSAPIADAPTDVPEFDESLVPTIQPKSTRMAPGVVVAHEEWKPAPISDQFPILPMGTHTGE